MIKLRTKVRRVLYEDNKHHKPHCTLSLAAIRPTVINRSTAPSTFAFAFAFSFDFDFAFVFFFFFYFFFRRDPTHGDKSLNRLKRDKPRFGRPVKAALLRLLDQPINIGISQTGVDDFQCRRMWNNKCKFLVGGLLMLKC